MSAKAKSTRKKNLVMPEPLPKGSVLSDIAKNCWKIGVSVGKGGFGEIYEACRSDSTSKHNNYPYVVKIEPHENGPLFVEMHFYMRNLKEADLLTYKKDRGLANLGLPKYVASGRHEINGNKYRFIVMERFHRDLWSIYSETGKQIPLHTVYRLAIQMVDILEYIHSKGYVHADIKGANILLDTSSTQAYLVDFGLASHFNTNDFKPDPKRMHNGTIEYTSRDAHLGVPTRRGDLEVLAYNLIHWSGKLLPWEKKLTNPNEVQKQKEEFMVDVTKSLKKVYNNNIPEPILDLFKFVAKIEHCDTPDYNKYRTIFVNGVKNLGKSITGKLDFNKQSSLNGLYNSPKMPKSSPINKRKSPRFLDNDLGVDGETVVKKTRKSPVEKVSKETKQCRERKESVDVSEGKKKRNKLDYSYSEDEHVEILIKKTNKRTGAVATKTLQVLPDTILEEDTARPQRNPKENKSVPMQDLSENSEDAPITPIKKKPRSKLVTPKAAGDKEKKSRWMDCPTIKAGKAYAKNGSQ